METACGDCPWRLRVHWVSRAAVGVRLSVRGVVTALHI